MSIYIHIPFCSDICSYCDFSKVFYNEDLVYKYLESLRNEIMSNYKNELVDTLYIGGGTPSCLSLDELEILFEIINIFNLSDDLEFTFECNIESIDYEKLIFLYNHGVNRLSIGVQTFNDKLLKLLNRHHTSSDVVEKISIAKEIGFDNINIDLMYALPGQSLSDLEKDIDMFLGFEINHISTYSLIINEHTKLYIDNVRNIDENLDCEMYELICNKLKDNGFHHYEISNFSKDGYNSKHNLVYWNNKNYYGFGCGASGYIDNVRYDNTRNITSYIKGNYKYSSEILSLSETIEYEFILGFRKLDGINITEFNNKYGDIFKYDVINKLIKEGKLINDGVNIYINPMYIYISNTILVEFVGGLYE